MVRNQNLKRTLTLFVNRSHGSNDSLSLLLRAGLDTVLNNITGEFVFGEIDQVRSHKRNGPATVLFEAMLNDVLHHVIAVLIDDQGGCRGVYFLKYRPASVLLAVLQHALNNPAAILVRRQLLNVTGERVDDKLDVFRRDSLKSLLDHMISILILDTFQNVVLKFSNQLGLLISQNVFQSLPRSVTDTHQHMHRDQPSALHGSRTFGRIVPQHALSFDWPSLSSAIDCRARRTSGSHSYQKHPSSAVPCWSSVPDRPGLSHRYWLSQVLVE